MRHQQRLPPGVIICMNHESRSQSLSPLPTPRSRTDVWLGVATRVCWPTPGPLNTGCVSILNLSSAVLRSERQSQVWSKMRWCSSSSMTPTGSGVLGRLQTSRHAGQLHGGSRAGFVLYLQHQNESTLCWHHCGLRARSCCCGGCMLFIFFLARVFAGRLHGRGQLWEHE